MTTAELREIRERIERDSDIFSPVGPVGHQACIDRARLHAALERLIERCLYGELATQQIKNKDAAIDALLKEQPQ